MFKIIKVFDFTILLISIFVSESVLQTCDENLVFEIDRIKQEIETGLINSTTLNLELPSGESLLAFYNEGKLTKISVDEKDKYISSELFFRDGFIKHIAEEFMSDGIFRKNYYYFIDDKLICFQNEKGEDFKDAKMYKEAENKWLDKVEKYLLAVQ